MGLTLTKNTNYETDRLGKVLTKFGRGFGLALLTVTTVSHTNRSDDSGIGNVRPPLLWSADLYVPDMSVVNGTHNEDRTN